MSVIERFRNFVHQVCWVNFADLDAKILMISQLSER